MSFLIRDGLKADIPACLALDADYDTERVWQMHVQPETNGLGVIFRPERLPRPMTVEYPSSEGRLRLALPDDQCFLVAARKDEPEVFGYVTMRADPVHEGAWVQDLVVHAPYRGQGIGTRLFRVATRWAREHGLTRIIVETQTKNYPAIQFCEAHDLVFCGFHDRYFLNGDIAVFFARSLR
jgi:GNAT superfamily N-acetyltransferase